MKLRIYVYVGLLAVVSMALMALPIQAEAPKTTFVAVDTAILTWNSECSITGNSSHCTNSFSEVIDSPDPRFRGTMYEVAVCNGPGANHPQATEIGWGPCAGTWRMEVTADSGWEGQVNGNPQADYRNGRVGVGIGQGYGALKGLMVEWRQDYVWEFGVQRTVTIKSDK